MKKIDLDVDLERNYENSVPSGISEYPEVSFTEDEPCDIPEEGVLTVKYRLVRHGKDTTDESKPRYSYTICLKELVSAVSKEVETPTKKHDEAGEALDAIAAEKMKSKEGEY